VIATALLARASIRAVLAKVGHPAPALDDAYIHFQYARAIAEGHPFRFQAGEPISTGATSFLWPMLLSVPYAAGARGDAIMWAAWAMSFAALGGLAYETYALARPLAGRGAALGAGAMTLAFGGFTWCAASGMEVVPFAWAIAAGTRRACDWVEQPDSRSRRALGFLLAFAVAAPLLRPEGLLATATMGAAVALAPASSSSSGRAAQLRARLPVLAFLVAGALPYLFLLALTGRATSSTAEVKLLVGNPYFSVADAALANARLLAGTILDGEVWSAEFLPRGGAPLAFAGLAALLFRGHHERRWFRAVAVLIVALSMFVPCFYVTFLWNRLRYLWPFATGWFVGLACLARVLSGFVARVSMPAAAKTRTLLAGAFAGALAVRLDWVIDDVAQSASGIRRQQSALGLWVDAKLPEGAIVGVNDTGAIAYFGNRRTFDVVGLTTPSEGRYWVAGVGSRLEHYERMKGGPLAARLPTHFIVYPEWMGMDIVLGPSLTEAIVTDSSILGGQIMRAYVARWDHLGSGEKPWTALQPVDGVDVADLESEAEHGYELLGARDGQQVAIEGNAPDGAVVIDGGRTQRTRDRFTLKSASGPARLVGRVEATVPIVLHVRVDGRDVGDIPVEAGAFQEVELALPAPALGGGPRNGIEVNATGGSFTSFHWWLGS